MVKTLCSHWRGPRFDLWLGTQGPTMLQLKILHAGIKTLGLPGGISGKEPTCQCRRCKRQGFDPWVRKIPWRRVWQLTPVFLPGEFHRQRSLVHWVAKSQTRLKQLSNHACTKPAYTASQTICPSKGFHLPRGRGTFSSHKAPSAFQTIS